MKIVFAVILSVESEHAFLQVVDPLPRDFVVELGEAILHELQGSLDQFSGVNVALDSVELPSGYEKPEPIDAQEPTWEDLSPRLRRILRDQHYFTSPLAAYERGESWLRSMVDGFGRASWLELSAFFEG